MNSVFCGCELAPESFVRERGSPEEDTTEIEQYPGHDKVPRTSLLF